MKEIKNHTQKKKVFVEPEMKVVKFDNSDIITTSGETPFEKKSLTTFSFMDFFNF